MMLLPLLLLRWSEESALVLLLCLFRGRERERVSCLSMDFFSFHGALFL